MTFNCADSPVLSNLNTAHFVPILIPDTVLKLNIPLLVFESAIVKFNYDVKNQTLFLTVPNTDTRIAEIVEIRRTEMDDLELVVNDLKFGGNRFWDVSKYVARLRGIVFMNVETGSVDEFVIEGFNLMAS